MLRVTLRLPPTASSGTRGLSAPGVRRAARPARPAASPARAPNPAAHPLRAAQLGLARPGWGREVGARTSKHPARPAELQASGEQHEVADPGPPHPAAPSRGRAELYLRRPLPAARPGAWRGAVSPSRGARRGGALLLPAAAARGQRGWAAPVKSEGARVWAPRPCGRQRGQGDGGPLPCLQIWSSVS